MARINETIKLPSCGKVYDTTELTLQNMTIAEEKFIYGSSSDEAINKILKNCIVEDIDPEDLIAPDKHYALVRLRVLTYGEEYPVDLRCPICGKEFSHTVKLSDLDVNELPEDYAEPRKITLPVCKDELDIVIPRSKDIIKYDNLAKKKAEKFNLNIDEVSYIYNLMLSIRSVNGEDMLEDEMYKYLTELSGRDSSYIKHQLSKIKVGYDTRLECDCPMCGGTVKFKLPMTTDFFLTEYTD